MIKEEYVSFEVAKLLKEKGFNEPTIGTYYKDGRFEELTKNYWNEIFITPICAPTQTMAIRWLREVHGLFIKIDVLRESSCWLAEILDIINDVAHYGVPQECSSYEEAAEAGIKYCLENLI